MIPELELGGRVIAPKLQNAIKVAWLLKRFFLRTPLAVSETPPPTHPAGGVNLAKADE